MGLPNFLRLDSVPWCGRATRLRPPFGFVNCAAMNRGVQGRLGDFPFASFGCAPAGGSLGHVLIPPPVYWGALLSVAVRSSPALRPRSAAGRTVLSHLLQRETPSEGSPSGISPWELPGSVSPEPAPAPGMPWHSVLCHLMGNRRPGSSHAPSPTAGVWRRIRAPSLPPAQRPAGSHPWHVFLWVCFSWFVRTLKYLGILGAGL